MKQRAVVFAPEARDDLLALYDWIEAQAGSSIALVYLERLERIVSVSTLRPSAGVGGTIFARACGS